MSTAPRPEYPRPQFRRDRWTNLNGEWSFAFDDDNLGRERGWQNVTGHALREPGPFDRTITVPFCYESSLSGIGASGFHDVVWYARTFDCAPAEDERLLLHFGAVDYRAEVWVNGVHVASHEGGHTPFSADVTHALAPGATEDVLVVRAEDPGRDVTIPRGKQYWREQSESIFYTRTTGIWQTVWLEPVNRSGIDHLRLTPNVDESCADAEITLRGVEPGMTLRVTAGFRGATVREDTVRIDSSVVDHRLYLLARGESFEFSGTDARSGLALWSPEEPNLYDLRLELLSAEGGILDAVESYFGMRKVETRRDGVYLNGRPLYQRLVLDQGYFPEGLLTAPTDEDLKRDIELAKEMGFNGARKHQKVEDPRYLFWADTLGFLVWGEMANAYRFSPDYVRRITAEWQGAVRRDYNHPSIVAWVPMNESWGVPNLESDPAQREHLLALYHLTRSLDGTRPVVSNDGWEHALTDLCAIHDYRDATSLAATYASPESSVAATPSGKAVYAPGYGYRGEPILVTEFGGIAFAGEARSREEGGEGPGNWGYTTVADAEEFLGRYEAVVAALLQSAPVRGFCYTQLTDVEQEVNGLLTYDRKPKADLARIRAITTGEPRRPRT